MEKNKKYVPYIIITISVIFLCIVSLNSSPLFKGIQHNDSSVFQIVGNGILNGKVMYKDLFDHKGPVIYFINAFAILINKDIGIFFIEIISFIIGSIYVYKTSRLQLNEKWSLLISIIYMSLSFINIEGGNFTEEYAITLITIAMFYISKILQKKDNKNSNWIIVGLTFALTFFIKPTYIAIWIAFGITEFIFSIIENRFKELIKYICFILLGIAICTLPIILYLVCTNSIEDFINSFFILNMKYSETTLVRRINTIKILVQTSKIKLYYILISFIGNLTVILNKNINKKMKIYIILFFIISVILTVWSGRTYKHYMIQMAPSISLISLYLIYSLIQLLKNKKEIIIKKHIPINFIYTLIIITIILNTGILSAKDSGILSNKELLGIQIKLELDKIKQYINENDNILVIGNQPYIYIYLNKQPEFKYFFQTPIVSYDNSIASETNNYIKNNRPKVVIVNLTEKNQIFNKSYWMETKNSLEENYIKYEENFEYYVLKEE